MDGDANHMFRPNLDFKLQSIQRIDNIIYHGTSQFLCVCGNGALFLDWNNLSSYLGILLPSCRIGDC